MTPFEEKLLKSQGKEIYSGYSEPSRKKSDTSTTMSVTEFNKNRKVQRLADSVFGYLSSENKIPFRESSSFKEDIAEAMRDDYDLTVLAQRALTLSNAPDKVKKDYAELLDIWNNKTEVKGWLESLDATKDIGIDLITDPTVALSLASGTVVARTAAQRALQGKAQSAIGKFILSDSIKSNTAKAGLAGATWGGGENFLEQWRDVSIEEKEKIDKGEVLESALIVGAVGAAIPGAGKAISKSYKKVKELGQKPKTKKIDEAFNVGESPRPVRKIIEEEEVEPLQASTDGKVTPEVEELSSKVGGGTKTAEELQDVVDESTRTKDPNLFEETQRLLLKTGTSLLLKPASYLNTPTLKGSATVKMLQSLFRYDVGKGAKGGEKVGKDFNENYVSIQGSFLTPFKKLIDPLKSTGFIRGRFNFRDKVTDDTIIKGLRGGDISKADSQIQEATVGVRSILNVLGQELKKSGFIEEVLPNYLPRMWSRKAIKNNERGFREILIKSKQAKNKEEANDIIDGMLDIKNNLDGNGASNNFFYNRSLGKVDDLDAEEFIIDTPLDELVTDYIMHASKHLAKTKTFGVRNLDEFQKKYLPMIENELAAKNKTFIGEDKENILHLYKMATGEGITGERFLGGHPADAYSTLTRMALLPLSTISSVTEIFLNFQKAGIFNTAAYKGFGKALAVSSKSLKDSTFQVLLNKKYTKQEAWRELEEFSMALDSAALDIGERLGGYIQGKGYQKANNLFFKTNLLDQWTRFVQLASFGTGKNLIKKNLESIARRRKSGLEPSGRIEKQIEELNELNIDIDAGVSWINKGANVDDSFYKDVKFGAARYTGEVILQPTATSGIKPALQANPNTQLFFQLLSYPTAFTNTVLYNVGKDLARDPLGKLPGTLAAGLIMTETARYTNWVRSRGESEKNKTEAEIYEDAIRRWGGNGVLFDMHERATRGAQAWQNPIMYPAGMFGPVVGDVATSLLTRSVGTVLADKVPGMSAFNTVEKFTGFNPREPIDEYFADPLDEFLKAQVPERRKKSKNRDASKYFKTGGEVNVPNAPEEPDERIDKFTGLPYNEQAGIAFKDEEDPLKRLGLAGGGTINSLERLGFKEGSEVTGKVTLAGRPVFKNKKGEIYSEVTTTLQLEKNKWVTFPTVDEKGESLSDAKVMKYLKENGPIDPITGEEFPVFENEKEASEYARLRTKVLLDN